jgi:hypothetical protein
MTRACFFAQNGDFETGAFPPWRYNTTPGNVAISQSYGYGGSSGTSSYGA